MKKIIKVDTSHTIATNTRNRTGININYLRDDDENNPGAREITVALKEMGAMYLRYPGGEKSDFHLFSKPPYDMPEPQVIKDYKEYEKGYRIMDFDSFMEIANSVKAVPHIVVGYDSFERTGIEKERYLENAVAWVTYANVKMGYDIRYWEIGNENWHNNTGKPAELAAIVSEFSREMKKVDPGIKIGASGVSREWWKEILDKAAADLDFLTISQYPCGDWNDFRYYTEHPEVNLIEQVDIALASIDEYSPGDKDRLKVVVGEFNSIYFRDDELAPDNDMGHAMVTFELIGQLLKHQSVEYGMLWNTRWMQEKNPETVWYALDEKNNLLPPGRILYIWNRFLSDKLVQISRTDCLVTFASLDEANGQLKLFLSNKGLDEDIVNVEILGNGYTEGRVYLFMGTGPKDRNPLWKMSHIVRIDGNMISDLKLPPVSITVIELT